MNLRNLRGRRSLTIITGLVLALAAGSTSTATAAPSAEPIFAFADPAIIESSGAAWSSATPGILFTHNDSGDAARFFAVDGRGCTVARFAVTGAEARDWEDLASGPDEAGRPTLWFGDIGDNSSSRASITVYGVNEPKRRHLGRSNRGAELPCGDAIETSVPARAAELVYPDGPHDAESLFADPASGRLYVVTKSYLPTAPPVLFATPLPLRYDTPNLLQAVAELHIPPGPVGAAEPLAAVPFGIGAGGGQVLTGAAMAPDGSRVIVRGYSSAYEWVLDGREVATALATPPRVVELPSQPQGEAITYGRDSRTLYVTSEDPLRTKPPVYRISR